MSTKTIPQVALDAAQVLREGNFNVLGGSLTLPLNDRIILNHIDYPLCCVIHLSVPSLLFFYNPKKGDQRLLLNFERDRARLNYCLDYLANGEAPDANGEVSELGELHDEPVEKPILDNDGIVSLTDVLWQSGLSITDGLRELGANPDEYDLEGIWSQVLDQDLDMCACCRHWFDAYEELDMNTLCELCAQVAQQGRPGKERICLAE